MNSYAEENYLKVIYKLSVNENKRIFTKSIADKIATKPSSVTDMIKKLAGKRLVNYEKYRGVTLTGRGESVAVDILRKHRLWEEFLSEYLGFKWDEVHVIAEQLEHINSDLLIEKLDRFLNFPKFDPHGNPIPDKNGVLPITESIKLADLDNGKSGIVTGFLVKTQSFVRYLNELDIRIGSEIEILQQIKFDQSIDILVDEKKKNHLSQKVSKNILIREQ